MLFLVTGHYPDRNGILVVGLTVRRQIEATPFAYGRAGQDIAGLQFVAVQAAYLFPYHRGGAAECGGDRKAVGDAQITAAAALGKFQGDSIARFDRVNLPRAPFFIIDSQWHARARNTDKRIDLRL